MITQIKTMIPFFINARLVMDLDGSSFSMAPVSTVPSSIFFSYTIFISRISTTRMNSTAKPVLSRKSIKDRCAALPIMIFGGSPIKVAVPPTLDARICPIRNGTGSIFSIRAMAMDIGPTSSTVVTLSKIAESTAVIRVKATMIFHGSPCTALAARTAIYSNIPD